MKYSFFWKFSLNLEADTEEDACRAAAKVFKKEASLWRGDRAATWKKQLHSPNLDKTKPVRVNV